MEYFLGSIITLIVISVLGILIKRTAQDHKEVRVRNSQSYFFYILGRFLDAHDDELRGKPSQAKDYLEKMHTRVFIVRDKAYWIKDNKVFVAAFADQTIDHENAQEVDIMGMDPVQLKEMLFIVDKLKEDNYNDNWNTR